MPKYEVILQVINRHKYIVEARSRDEAREMVENDDEGKLEPVDITEWASEVSSLYEIPGDSIDN